MYIVCNFYLLLHIILTIQFLLLIIMIIQLFCIIIYCGFKSTYKYWYSYWQCNKSICLSTINPNS